MMGLSRALCYNTMTLRDKVWAQVLVRLLDHENIRKGDLDIDDSERATVQRVLQAMEDIGILERESPGGTTWHRGEAWFWITRATPEKSILWDRDAEQLVLDEVEAA